MAISVIYSKIFSHIFSTVRKSLANRISNEDLAGVCGAPCRLQESARNDQKLVRDGWNCHELLVTTIT